MPDPEDPDEPTGRQDSAHRPDGLDLARSVAKQYRNVDGTGRVRPRPRRRTNARPPASEPSGAHPDDRDPQTLDATMGRLVAEHGWETDVAVHGLFGRWSSIVGEEIAQHCHPDRFADGRLFVQADSTAWATQLRLLAPRVVAIMNDTLGDGTVTHIVVLGPQGPSWKRGRRSVRGRGPRDTYG